MTGGALAGWAAAALVAASGLQVAIHVGGPHEGETIVVTSVAVLEELARHHVVATRAMALGWMVIVESVATAPVVAALGNPYKDVEP